LLDHAVLFLGLVLGVGSGLGLGLAAGLGLGLVLGLGIHCMRSAIS